MVRNPAIGLPVEKCTIVDARIGEGVFFVNSSFYDQQRRDSPGRRRRTGRYLEAVLR
jgi:hypothetical protein